VSVKARLDVNVALNRPSFMSSTHAPFEAMYANDGHNNTNMSQMPRCSKTGSETNPWWAVDLGVALYIWGIKFTNRGDCCGTYMYALSSTLT